MSPKPFRKIYHPEPKILNSLVNCLHTDGHTHACTKVNLELTPPEVGQLTGQEVFNLNQVKRGTSPKNRLRNFGKTYQTALDVFTG